MRKRNSCARSDVLCIVYPTACFCERNRSPLYFKVLQFTRASSKERKGASHRGRALGCNALRSVVSLYLGMRQGMTTSFEFLGCSRNLSRPLLEAESRFLFANGIGQDVCQGPPMQQFIRILSVPSFHCLLIQSSFPEEMRSQGGSNSRP